MRRWKDFEVSQSRLHSFALVFTAQPAFCTRNALCIFPRNGMRRDFGDPPPGAFWAKHEYTITRLQRFSLEIRSSFGGAVGKQSNRPIQESDTILYASIDLSTKVMTGPYTVLARRPAAGIPNTTNGPPPGPWLGRHRFCEVLRTVMSCFAWLQGKRFRLLCGPS